MSLVSIQTRSGLVLRIAAAPTVQFAFSATGALPGTCLVRGTPPVSVRTMLPAIQKSELEVPKTSVYRMCGPAATPVPVDTVPDSRVNCAPSAVAVARVGSMPETALSCPPEPATKLASANGSGTFAVAVPKLIAFLASTV